MNNDSAEPTLQEIDDFYDGLRVVAAAAVDGAPGATDAERAAWLADKIVAHGDYAKEAAAMLRRWPVGVMGSAADGGENHGAA